MKKLYISLSALLVTGLAAQAQDGMGIGNNNPQEMLDVTGAIKIGTTTNTNAGAIRWNGSNFQGYDGTQWVDLDSQGGVDADWTVSGNNQYSAVSGNVGVGANTPLAKLHVDGSNELFRLKGNSTNMTMARYYTNSSPRYDFTTLTATGAQITVYDQNGTYASRIGAGGPTFFRFGNVGIGTDTPDQKLEVVGTARVSTLSGVGTRMVVADANGDMSTQALPSADADWTVSGNDQYSAVSGNVGIGTTAPTNPLTINGTSTDALPILSLRSGNAQTTFNDGAQIAFSFNGTDDYQHFIQTRHNAGSQNNAIDFYVSDGVQNNTLTTGSTHVMSLNAGNVGIGTTSPTADLEVNGTVKITGGAPGSGKVLTSDADGDATWVDLVPSGAVMYFDLPGCPTGWSEFTAGQGRYIVGTPSGGTDGATVGTALSNQENRATGAHNHSIDPPNTSTSSSGAHNHDFYTANNDVNDYQSQGYPANNNHRAFRTTDRRQRTEDNGTIQTAGSHSHTVDIPAFNSASSGSVAGTNAPYVQLKVCRKD